MSRLRTVGFVILAIVLGAITTELIAGDSVLRGLVFVVATVAWVWLLLRGHRREAHKE